MVHVDCRFYMTSLYAGVDPGFLKRGGGGPSYVYKQTTGGPGGGPTLGPMLNSLQRGPKRGVRTPGPPPPGSAHGMHV